MNNVEEIKAAASVLRAELRKAHDQHGADKEKITLALEKLSEAEAWATDSLSVRLAA